MVYSEDLREKVMKYIDMHYSQSYVAKLFGISTKTVWNWIKLRNDTGGLKPKPFTRGPTKLKADELQQYVTDNPQACLREIAQHFNCRVSSVHSRMKSLGTKYRKKRAWSRKRRERLVFKK
ncbi:transposase [Alphaproteobacteria bacterium]|nr:transposase [Alphaproteobacteria bacterium]